MGPIKHLTPFISVSGQPDSAAMESAARASGLDYHYLPVIAGQVNDKGAIAFRMLTHQVNKGLHLA